MRVGSRLSKASIGVAAIAMRVTVAPVRGAWASANEPTIRISAAISVPG